MRTLNFFKIFALTTVLALPGVATAVQAPNPRLTASRSADSASRNVTNNTNRRSNATVSRTARPARNAVVTPVAQSGVVANRPSASVARTARSTTGSVATTARATTARTARNRGTTARATAVFNDTSKIGGDYAQCREGYATCMDQFCANANDTYRRCFCSERFAEFRNTEAALDQAKTLLMEFDDRNLEVVGMTAAEVRSMYTATVGEKAIKRDTSAAQKTLNKISDLLSGKTIVSENNSTSLGILSVDFSADIGDIWGDSGDTGIFGDSSAVDMSKLEGDSLYRAASKQCSRLLSDSCSSDAMFNMVKSSYSILITQDCNVYEKKIKAQREAVAETVRTAEKYLREARLEEYRSHNSADVNACLDAVRTALTADTACGTDYKRCLDYTGAYIDQATGEPIYSPRLFQLTSLIDLNGSSAVMDVLKIAKNKNFVNFLDSRRMFATSALDTCRDIADTVWNEFKRSALIEIAQAQDAKIEEVKMSCVGTIRECYDTQLGDLRDFDDTTAQRTGAMSAIAAKAMCREKVAACASLYSNGNTVCTFDSATGKITNASACGLEALISFIDSVDDVRIAEGCVSSLNNYIKELCTPASGDIGFPWKCRLTSKSSIESDLKNFAGLHCQISANLSSSQQSEFEALDAETKRQVNNAIDDLIEQMDNQLMDVCETMHGTWLGTSHSLYSSTQTPPLLSSFYSSVFAGNNGLPQVSWGKCVENSDLIACANQNPNGELSGDYATWNATTNQCQLTDLWYNTQCTNLPGGFYDNGICYVPATDTTPATPVVNQGGSVTPAREIGSLSDSSNMNRDERLSGVSFAATSNNNSNNNSGNSVGSSVSGYNRTYSGTMVIGNTNEITQSSGENP